MIVFLRVLRLVFSALLTAFLFLSPLHAHDIEVKASLVESMQPTIDVSKSGEVTIETTLPNLDGVSINVFEEFVLDGTPPVIEIDEDTKVLILRVTGTRGTALKNVHGLVAKRNGWPVQELKIIIENPLGIYASNCTIVGNEVTLIGKNWIKVDGLGLNVTGSLALQGNAIDFHAPVMANDLSISGNRFNNTNSVYAENRLEMKFAQSVHNTGQMQALVVLIDTPLLENQKSEKVIIVAFDKQHGLDAAKLRIVTGYLNNAGNLRSQGIFGISSSTTLQNTGHIESYSHMHLEMASLKNTGTISSFGDLSLTAPKGKAAKEVINKSGRIFAKGPGFIKADRIANFPAGFEIVKDTLTTIDRHETAVTISLPSEFTFLEKRKHQHFQSEVEPSLMQFQNGLTLEADFFDNTMSRIEVHGPMIFAKGNQTDISQNSVHLFIKRDLFAQDVYDDSIFGTACHQPLLALHPMFAFVAFFSSVRHAFVGENWKSLSMDASRKLNPTEVSYTRSNQAEKCQFSIFNNGRHQGLHCNEEHRRFQAVMAVDGDDGSLTGEGKNLHNLIWQQSEAGTWVNSPAEFSLKVENVKPSEQIILPQLADIIANQHLYEKFVQANQQHFNTETHEVAYVFSEIKESPRFYEGGGLNALIPYFSQTPKEQVLFALSPAMEQPFIERMMINYLGALAPTYQKLWIASAQYIRNEKLVFGAALSDQQIAKLTSTVVIPVFMEITVAEKTIRTLLPVIYVDKLSLALGHSSSITAPLIDLQVNDMVNQGLIESTKKNFRLYAKNIANCGTIKSADDIELYADAELLIVTLVDEITGQRKGRASVVAKGQTKLTGKKSLQSIGAYVEGGNIKAMSDGDIVIIPQNVLSEFKDLIAQEFVEERRRIFCTDFVGSQWSAGKKIEIHALKDVKIAGSSFKAQELIKIKSDEGDIVTEQIKKICDKEIITKESGFWGFLTATTQKAANYVEETVRNVFETAKDGAIELEAKENIKMEAFNMTTGTLNATAKNITFSGTKSKNKECLERQSNYLFSKDAEGRFHVWGHADEKGCIDSETVDLSHLNVERAYIHATEFVTMAGVHGNATNGKFDIRGDKGVRFLSISTDSIASWRKASGGFYFDIVVDPGELSAGVGAYTKYNQTGSQAQMSVDNHFVSSEGVEVTSKSGEIEFEGGKYYGDMQLNAKRINMRPSFGKICIDSFDILAEISVRAGIKSRLMKALANAIKLAGGNVEVWEDGVNLGFKVFSSGVEIATGLLMPVEGGLWARGKIEANSSSECFTFISAPTVVGANITLTAEECIKLEAVEIHGAFGEIKAKCLHIKAAATDRSKTTVGGSLEGDVPLLGVGVASVTASGAYEEEHQKTHHNSHINFSEKLKMSVEEEAIIEGAVIRAKELEADFGSLVMTSLQDEMTKGGFKGSISLDPKALAGLAKSLTGGSGGMSSYKRKVVSEMTALLGIGKANIVVRGLAKVVGAMIANAEKNPDGTYTDKGNLQLKMGQLVQEDLQTSYFGVMLGGGYSKSTNKGLHGTVSGEFGFANQHGQTKATLGKGNATLVNNDTASQEALAKINRDVNKAEGELEGIDIKALYATIPIPNLSDGGVHFKAYLKAIGQCSQGFNCMRDSAREILRGMGWLPDKYLPLTKGQKDWRDLFREQVKFSDEITPEEAEQILEDVEKETKATDEKIQKEAEQAKADGDSERAENTEFAKTMQEQAKAQRTKAKVQEILQKKAPNEGLRKKAEDAQKFYQRQSEFSEGAAKQFAGAKKEQIAGRLLRQMSDYESILTRIKDTEGLNQLQNIKRMVDGGMAREATVMFAAFHMQYCTGDIKSLGDLFTGIAGGAKNFLGATLGKAAKSAASQTFRDFFGLDGFTFAGSPEAFQQKEIDRIMKILKPDGSWVGEAGSDIRIRELLGGEDAAGQFIKELTKNGAYPMEEVVNKKTGERNGFYWKLPGGTGSVTYRQISKSGPATISINLESKARIKLKF